MICVLSFFSPISFSFIFLINPLSLYFIFFLTSPLCSYSSLSLSLSHSLSLPLLLTSHLHQLYHHHTNSSSLLSISHLSFLLRAESVTTTVSRHFSCFKSILSSCAVVEKRTPCPDVQWQRWGRRGRRRGREG